MDFDPGRRDEAAAKFGAKTYDDYNALLADENVELVVVATPNSAHKSNVVAALEAGKHAVCEKPFGTTSAEADEMIAAAQRTGNMVAPFQNRRYESHFLKVREIVQSGVLGELHLIRLCAHGFGRRWDWQTLREFSGGFLNNWGPHVVDHALQLMNLDDNAPDPELWVDMRNVLSSGDAEDHIKLVLRSEGGPVVDIELSSAIGFGKIAGWWRAKVAPCAAPPTSSNGNGSIGARCQSAPSIKNPQRDAATTQKSWNGSKTSGKATTATTI
jgi:predicted dehydrogenase